MKCKFIFLLSLLVLLGGGCAPRIKNSDAKGDVVICFGDSITKGVGAPPGEEYPVALDKMIALTVVNYGEKGNTTGDALKRLERDVLVYSSKMVIVILGGNDFLKKVKKEETLQNIEEIITRIQDNGAMVALGTVRLGFVWDPYSKDFARIAKKHQAIFLGDVLRGIMDNPKYKYDRIHPNAEGYKLMAERIYRKIRPYIGL